MKFLSEITCYQYLQSVGIRVPPFLIYTPGETESNGPAPFADGTEIVIKGIADEIWHKTEQGVIFFSSWPLDGQQLAQYYQLIVQRLAGASNIQMLVCTKIDFVQVPQVPTEFFASVTFCPSLGPLLTLGLGGLQIEHWARAIPPLVLAVDLMSIEEMMAQISTHLLGKLLLGQMRQLPALTTCGQLQHFVQALATLAHQWRERGELLEINPWVVRADGDIVALDGVGREREQAIGPVTDHRFLDPQLAQALLRPEKVAIAGVSDGQMNVGRIIFENLRTSSQLSALTVIRPKGLIALAADPHDLLILALPIGASVEAVGELCEQGAGARVVYLVAGITAQEAHWGQQLQQLLAERRAQGLYAPVVIGPNGLGMVLGPGQFNSLFIPPARLPVVFNQEGKVALLSQSGAFILSALAATNAVPLAYAISMGNQWDITMVQLAQLLVAHTSVRLLLFYVEGWSGGEMERLKQLAQEAQVRGVRVLIYRGGTSGAGQKAAAGHTGALEVNSQMETSLLRSWGLEICGSLRQFWQRARLYHHYPQLVARPKIWVLSNAGVETVLCADRLGELLAAPLPAAGQAQLQSLLAEWKLQQLVTVQNPLDLTPMASEEVFVAAMEIIVRFVQVDLFILGIVPFSVKINTEDCAAITRFAQRCQQLGVPVAVAVDGGDHSASYRQQLAAAGLLVFGQMEEITAVYS